MRHLKNSAWRIDIIRSGSLWPTDKDRDPETAKDVFDILVNMLKVKNIDIKVIHKKTGLTRIFSKPKDFEYFLNNLYYNTKEKVVMENEIE